MNKVLRASVKNERLIYENPLAYQEILRKLKGLVEVVFRKPRSPRTIQQNKYLWILYQIIADHIGYTKDEVHEALGNKFLLDNSEKLPKRRSTTDLSIQELSFYIEQIKKWTSEFLGFTLPEPNEIE